MATPTATAREHSPLAVLMDPRRDIPIAETDIRVEDFLSDKIQTAADLADLKSLLAKVEEQKKILQAQVSSHPIDRSITAHRYPARRCSIATLPSQTGLHKPSLRYA